MDCTKVIGLLDNLDDEIDDLKEAMAPLLESKLSTAATKFPVLDKAKLYVLTTYAIESLIFSYLRLNGINAREHPVFLELTRVKQYFEKIKQAEIIPTERNLVVDKGAASRFIKAGLAGNDKFDLQKAEQLAKERARAHIRFKEIKISENKFQTESVDLNGRKEFSGLIDTQNQVIVPHSSSAEQKENKRSRRYNENDNTKSKKRSRKRKVKKQTITNQ